MPAVVNVKIKHVTFVEVAVHERLLAPVVVSNLFPNLASFAAHGEEPVIPPGSQRNVFDGIPKLLSFRVIGKETPVVIFAKQVIGWCRRRGLSGRSRLGLREQQSGEKHDYKNQYDSHVSLRTEVHFAKSVETASVRQLFNSSATKAFFASIVGTVSEPKGTRNGGFGSSRILRRAFAIRAGSPGCL